MLRRCHRGVLQPRAPAPHDALACRCISANTHPDHRTLAAFRKRFLNELAGLFTAVRRIAPAMGLLTLGTVSRAGTTRTAHARQHQALSCAHANRLEAQLKNAVEQRMRLAEQADHEPRPAPVDIPLELKRRAPRRAVIAAAKEEIEARAPARYEAEQAEYERQPGEREARTERTDRKPGGQPPKAPEPGPRAQDQVSLTAAESRIMPTAGGGCTPAYHAPAGVATETPLSIAPHVTDPTNDQQEVGPARARLDALPEALGAVKALLADTGYHRQENLDRCKAAGLDPDLPEARQRHHPPSAARLAADPPAPPGQPTPAAATAQRRRTREGKARYAKRQATVETVFGIIKHVPGCRQFLRRGLQAVPGEWALGCMGGNLK